MNQVLDLYTRKVNDMKKEVNFIIGCHDEAKYIKEIERLNNEIKKLKSKPLILFSFYHINFSQSQHFSSKLSHHPSPEACEES